MYYRLKYTVLTTNTTTRQGYPGVSISFKMLHCFKCRTYLSRESLLASPLGSLLNKWWALETKIKAKVVERLKEEKKKTDDKTLVKAGFQAGDLFAYGMSLYVYVSSHTRLTRERNECRTTTYVSLR